MNSMKPGVPSRQPTTYYVAADGSDQNKGTDASYPFLTLNAINRLTLGPGDRVLLRRGDVFDSQFLHIKGAGSQQAPIIVTAYGNTDQPLPRINAYGTGLWFEDYHRPLDNPKHPNHGTVSSTILLKDVPYIEVSDLEITNARQASDHGRFNDPDAMDRTGVAVIAENAGTINHVVIRNLHVHDVDGNVYHKHMANGGIYVIAHVPEDPTSPVARFNDVQIRNNRVENVRRWGIGVGYTGYASLFNDVAEIPDELIKRYGHTNVVIRENYLADVGGDAITPFYCDRPLIESNVSLRAARLINDDDYLLPQDKVAAAIWPWKCKNALFQFNEAYSTLGADRGNGDGQAWDADYGDGTIYQFNYSHGNTGGAVMFCGKDVVNSTFRFNISQGDLGGLIDLPDQLPEAHIYHNTFVVAPGVEILGHHPVDGNALIENNVFIAAKADGTPKTEASTPTSNGGATKASLHAAPTSGIPDEATPHGRPARWNHGGGSQVYHHNVYVGFSNLPDSDTNPVLVPAGQPLLRGPSGPGVPRSDWNLGENPCYPRTGEFTVFDGYRLVADLPAADTTVSTSASGPDGPIKDQNGFPPVPTDFFGVSLNADAASIGAVTT